MSMENTLTGYLEVHYKLMYDSIVLYVYSQALERSRWLMVEPLKKEKQCQFAAEYEAASMTISGSKFKAMVLIDPESLPFLDRCWDLCLRWSILCYCSQVESWSVRSLGRSVQCLEKCGCCTGSCIFKKKLSRKLLISWSILVHTLI